jgi:signal transduction histidine kinase
MPLFIEKNVRIESSGGGADNVTVLIDAAHLERVIVNLLEAALERSRAGDIVIVRVNEDSEALLASFEDNGAGIAPKARENIFAKFNLAGSSAPGSALRLHFCRIVIQNGGGEIGCDPLPAGGNRFWIRLTKSGAVG